jgi:hypothetical protein
MTILMVSNQQQKCSGINFMRGINFLR